MNMTSKRSVLIINTSVIIVLHELGRSFLLNKLLKAYDIVIPEQVYGELKKGREFTGVDVRFIRKVSLNGIPSYITVHFISLGEGEKAAIALAHKLKVEGRKVIVITDDKKARKVCKRIGIRVRGTLGLIFLAKIHRIIDKAIALDLLKRIPYTSLYISRGLLNRVITQVMENCE